MHFVGDGHDGHAAIAAAAAADADVVGCFAACSVETVLRTRTASKSIFVSVLSKWASKQYL